MQATERQPTSMPFLGQSNAVLQFVRLIRDANLPDRKLFVQPDELFTWLSRVLTAPEQARLKAFLSEGAP